jgi:hypothetical protein
MKKTTSTDAPPVQQNTLFSQPPVNKKPEPSVFKQSIEISEHLDDQYDDDFDHDSEKKYKSSSGDFEEKSIQDEYF